MNNQTVTKLEKQKRRERCNVWLDGAYSFSVNLNVVAEFGLHRGKILNHEEIETLKEADTFSKVYRRALLILSYRMHGEKELTNKLKKHFDEPLVAKAVQRLRQLDLLNDAYYLQAYVDNSPKSKKAIAYDLLKKGFSKTQIQSVLDSLTDESELTKARKILAKSPRRFQEDPKEKAKVVRRLASKGFSYQIIKKAIEKE